MEGDGAAVVARDVVADADGEQFYRALALDEADDFAQMLVEIAAGISGKRGVVDRGAVADDHQDFTLFAARLQALVGPDDAFAVDIFLEDAVFQHEAEIAAGAA